MRLMNRLSRDARLIFILMVSNLFLFLCCIMSLLALYQCPSEMNIYIPPDLNNGALVSRGQVPKSYLYEFALNIWQVLNDWPLDGETDYIKNLNQYRAYLSPGFYQELYAQYHLLKSKGEISHRIRQIRLSQGFLIGVDGVKVLDGQTWEVDLPIQLTEFVNGVSVKIKNLIFPLLVGRSDDNHERNPFGLVLLGFSQLPYPQVIKEAENV